MAGTTLTLSLTNAGVQTLQLATYTYHLPGSTPIRIDLAPQQPRALTLATPGVYDVVVHGPNGFLASWQGDARSPQLGIEATLRLTGPSGQVR